MHVLVQVLQAIFIAGWIGCAITIPICAWKYFSVLFEKDVEEASEVAPTDSDRD